MKQYYKILHEDLKHYDMQYHLGLNEDVKSFNPEPECGGGLFFSDKEHVLDYLKYNEGTKLAIIKIPKGEQIVKVDDKYKAHRIIITEIQELWISENYDWLLNYFENKNILFQCSCRNGALDFTKWLYANFKKIDIHNNNDSAFRLACENGHLETAKWLHTIGNVNIHINDDFAFRIACMNDYLKIAKWLHFCYFCQEGYLEVAKRLYSLGNIDIHALDEYVFRATCKNGHLEVAKWLYKLGNVNIQSYIPELFSYSPEYVLNWIKTL